MLACVVGHGIQAHQVTDGLQPVMRGHHILRWKAVSQSDCVSVLHTVFTLRVSEREQNRGRVECVWFTCIEQACCNYFMNKGLSDLF